MISKVWFYSTKQMKDTGCHLLLQRDNKHRFLTIEKLFRSHINSVKNSENFFIRNYLSDWPFLNICFKTIFFSSNLFR